MVDVLISIWSVVSGRWLLVGDLWSVGGGFVLRPYEIYDRAINLDDIKQVSIVHRCVSLQ